MTAMWIGVGVWALLTVGAVFVGAQMASDRRTLDGNEQRCCPHPRRYHGYRHCYGVVWTGTHWKPCPCTTYADL